MYQNNNKIDAEIAFNTLCNSCMCSKNLKFKILSFVPL